MDGFDVWWDGWGILTSEIRDDRYIYEQCNLCKFFNIHDPDSTNGKDYMVFVFSVHSYLKNGYVRKEAIVKKVDQLIKDINEGKYEYTPK